MARFVTLDELQVVVRVPADMPAAQLRAVRRTLADKRWFQRLRRGVQAAFRTESALAQCRVNLTR